MNRTDVDCFGVPSLLLALIWLLLFVLLSDFNCPLFFTRYASCGWCGDKNR